MPQNGLADERIVRLFSLFNEKKDFSEWKNNYLGEVQYFKNLSDDSFKKPENQERLWRCRGISSIGPGEAVDTSGAYTDPKVVDTILALRARNWSKEVDHRAKEVQKEYDQILGLVHQAHSKSRPNAKLGRLLTALIPEHMHTCYKWDAYRKVANLILGNPRYQLCDGAVRIRQRLREALGEEKSLEDHITRSTFCWWLYEEFSTIVDGKDPEPFDDTPKEFEDTATLIPWPAAKQIRGLVAVQGYLESFRAVVNASMGGATPEDIVSTMQSDMGFSDYSEKSCRVVFNRVRRLGFLVAKEGLWYPSDDGERLVEEDPPDLLVEKYLTQTFGLGHFLQFLGKNERMQRKEIFGKMQEIYPNWTTDFMPSSLGAWSASLGLTDIDAEGYLSLTDYGKEWFNRLPENLPVPTVTEKSPEVDIDTTTKIESELKAPKFNEIQNAFMNDDELKKFIFSDEDILSLYLAWHSQAKKRFVLLSGLSGTGKTALLLHFARIYCNLLNIDVAKHRATIVVSPDWRDPTAFLGYFNALHADPTFQAEPALRLVLDAVKNPDLPYFLILDEMNLARVEKYFAPFLSAMETGEKITIHAHDDEVNGVPPSISWPSNLFIGGTVNMDETTHAFSDKVLDRAFTLEFWNVDLKRFFECRPNNEDEKRYTEVEGLLMSLNKLLFKIRRHFGYRTAGEILNYITMADIHGVVNDNSLWQLVDQAVFSKVLPRFRGNETTELKEILENTKLLCNQKGMKRCEEKIDQMMQQLTVTGLTRFWA